MKSQDIINQLRLIADSLEQEQKPTLDKIIADGKARMSEAVEVVIARRDPRVVTRTPLPEVYWRPLNESA
jgi:hypothetical protein